MWVGRVTTTPRQPTEKKTKQTFERAKRLIKKEGMRTNFPTLLLIMTHTSRKIKNIRNLKEALI